VPVHEAGSCQLSLERDKRDGVINLHVNRGNSEDLVLRETDDRAAMRRLAIESGLEEGTLDKIVVAYGIYQGTRLVGCSALKLDNGCFSVECLAVNEEYRRRGLGAQLVRKVEEDARRRGAQEIWALARAPGFFEAIGFRGSEHPSEGAPSTIGCKSCRQYQATCFPAIVVKDL